MSAGVDLSQFYETFFDEADELLADMEQILLNVDIDQPDPDQLNAIFARLIRSRAEQAHSVASANWLTRRTCWKTCSMPSVRANSHCGRT